MSVLMSTVAISVWRLQLRENAMTDDLTGIRHRQDRLEGRVATLEARVDEEAGLRAQMDEDVSKLHIQKRMLQALIDTQGDHTAQLRNIDRKLDNVELWMGVFKGRMELSESRLTGVEVRLTGMEDKITRVEGRLTGVEVRLTGMEDKITRVEGRLTGVEGRLTGVEETLGNVNMGVHAILDLLNANLAVEGDPDEKDG
jgi:chromosome segregation ATPase